VPEVSVNDQDFLLFDGEAYGNVYG